MPKEVTNTAKIFHEFKAIILAAVPTVSSNIVYSSVYQSKGDSQKQEKLAQKADLDFVILNFPSHLVLNCINFVEIIRKKYICKTKIHKQIFNDRIHGLTLRLINSLFSLDYNVLY